jgi:hypothetical protein
LVEESDEGIEAHDVAGDREVSCQQAVGEREGMSRALLK